ncbi:MAG: exosortase/archaeosortase family protein [Opitutae bacterium]|nr:exosortase/archaeosortase family protein [Opitutae bacterium]
MSQNSDQLNLKDLPKSLVSVVFLILFLAAFMVWDQSYWWESRDDYSFGYLVPLFALYVIYDRKEAIIGFITHTDSNKMNDEKKGSLWICNLIAISCFITGSLLYLVGGLLRAATMPQNPATLAISMGFALVLLSSVFIFSSETIYGKKMLLKNRLKLTFLFLFPALIWLISAPLVSVLETQMRVFLLTQVTIVVFTLMDFLGFEIERQGNILVLPKGVVGVEEACSGIRSLTACLFAGSFLASVYLKKFWKKILLVIMAMIFAVLTNLFRSGFLTLWAYFYGAEAINDHWILPLIGDIGSVHDVMGMAVLILTTIGLICLLPILNFNLNTYLNRLNDSVKPEETEVNTTSS